MIEDKVNVKAICFMQEKFENLCSLYIHESESNQQCGADVMSLQKLKWLPVGITDDRKLVSIKWVVS
jgi:hypothetical protein